MVLFSGDGASLQRCPQVTVVGQPTGGSPKAQVAVRPGFLDGVEFPGPTPALAPSRAGSWCWGTTRHRLAGACIFAAATVYVAYELGKGTSLAKMAIRVELAPSAPHLRGHHPSELVSTPPEPAANLEQKAIWASPPARDTDQETRGDTESVSPSLPPGHAADAAEPAPSQWQPIRAPVPLQQPEPEVMLLHASLEHRFDIVCPGHSEYHRPGECIVHCRGQPCLPAVQLCRELAPQCKSVDISIDKEWGMLKSVGSETLTAACESHQMLSLGRGPAPDRVARPAPLQATRTLWASGWDAKSRQGFRLATDPVLVWSEQAEAIFSRRWKEIQFNHAGCEASVRRAGYTVVDVSFEWGVASVMRDLSDQLLYGFLEGTVVVWNGPGAMGYAHEFRECAGGRFWLEGCFFDAFSNCQADFLAHRMGHPRHSLIRRVPDIAEETNWFLQRSQPIWDEMVAAGAVELRACDGGPSSHPNAGPPRLQHLQRLAMFRSLLLKVAFKPNHRLRQSIDSLAAKARAEEFSKRRAVVAIHVRRTDKKIDFGNNGVGGAPPPQWSLSLAEGPLGVAVFRPLIEYVRQYTEPSTGFFLLSDDPRVYRQEILSALFRSRENQTTSPWVGNPFMRSGFLASLDDQHLDQGHESWSKKPELYLQVLTEVYAAAESSQYVVGCGSSGVSQLVAQLLGARFGMDPNVLGLWEDDPLSVRFALEWRRRKRSVYGGGMWTDETPEERALLEALIDPRKHWHP